MTLDTCSAYLRSIVPEWGQEIIDGTLAGDPDAAGSLACALHDYQRAEVAAILHGHIAPAAFRELLSLALTQTHGYSAARRLAGSRKAFVEWCRYAQFAVPSLPSEVQVYRGARDVSPRWANRQLSWSLDFDDFAVAYRAGGPGSTPPTGFVIEATVRSSKIMFFDNDRKEQEVMFEATPRQFKTHDDQLVLRQAAERYSIIARGSAQG